MSGRRCVGGRHRSGPYPPAERGQRARRLDDLRRRRRDGRAQGGRGRQRPHRAAVEAAARADEHGDLARRRARRSRRGQQRDLRGRHLERRPPRHGDDADRPVRRPIRQRRRATPKGTAPRQRCPTNSPSSTSATRAPTCCATGDCAGSPSTTTTCRSWSPPGTSPTTRPAPTPAATSSPAPSASTRRCASTRGRCRSCAATASCSAPTACPTRSTTTRSTRSARPSTIPRRRPKSSSPPPTATAGATTCRSIVVDVVDGADPPAADERARHRAGVAADAGGRHVGGDRPDLEPNRRRSRISPPSPAPRQRRRVITAVAGGTRVITAERADRRPRAAEEAPPRRRVPALGARARHLVTVFVIIAAYARRGYYRVTFDDGDRRRHLPRPRLPVVRADARGDLPVQPRPTRRQLGRARRAPVRLHQRRRRRGLPQRPHPDDDHHHDDDHDRPRPRRRRPRRPTEPRATHHTAIGLADAHDVDGSSVHDGAGRTPRPGPPLHRAVADGDGRA